MQNFYALKNTIQTYVWGSYDGIPAFTGIVNTDDEPMAELWMGSHPAGPSRVLVGRESVTLDKFIAEHPVKLLGKPTNEKYGTSLPFLFKVLSAAKPLSLQVHPTKEQAENGFARENEAGIPLLSPLRNYKDKNHKQEILMAITEFTIMCGFRDEHQTAEYIGRIDSPILTEAIQRLNKGGYRDFCHYLLELNPEDRKSAIASAITATHGTASTEEQTAFALAIQLAAHYPDDIGCLAPLYLNVIHLNPGEAVFLPEGIMHTYIKGTGLELMANSDNTLRGGLTAKHLDIPELLEVLNPAPYKPEILKPETSRELFTYRTHAADFELSTLNMKDGKVSFSATAPAILIGCSGELLASSSNEEMCKVGRGSIVFIPASGNTITFSGNGTCFIASIPGTIG